MFDLANIQYIFYTFAAQLIECMTRKVLVILHIFYKDQIPYFAEKIKNIRDCEWDLLVTGTNLDRKTKDSILAFKPNTIFVDTPNVGYDIWPFIQAIQSIDLNNYDIVLKLHTKNNDGIKTRVNGRKITGGQWRELMVNAMLKDRERFHELIAEFSQRPSVGMLYSKETDVVSKGNTIEDSSMLKGELARLGINPSSLHYCAGTMFAAKAKALKFLQTPLIHEGIFQKTGPSHGTGTMAHVYERLIPIAIYAQGYSSRLIAKSLTSNISIELKKKVQPVAEWLFSINHYGSNYDKYLTLCGHRILLRRTI